MNNIYATTDEILHDYKISRTTLRRWIKNGQFPRPLNIPQRRTKLWLTSVLKIYNDSLLTGKDWQARTNELIVAHEKTLDTVDDPT